MDKGGSWYAPRAALLKLEHASESPERLMDTQTVGPTPSFIRSGVGSGNVHF